jgi:hypothetical protein
MSSRASSANRAPSWRAGSPPPQLVALAGRDPRHIASMALVAPTGCRLQTRSPRRRRAERARLLLGAPLVGNTVYNGLTSPAKLRRHLENVYVDDRLVTPALVQHYQRMARSRAASTPSPRC